MAGTGIVVAGALVSAIWNYRVFEANRVGEQVEILRGAQPSAVPSLVAGLYDYGSVAESRRLASAGERILALERARAYGCSGARLAGRTGGRSTLLPRCPEPGAPREERAAGGGSPVSASLPPRGGAPPLR